MIIRVKVWLEDEHGNAVFGEGRKKILELVEEKGSLAEAAKELKMSYRAVWGKIHTTEKRLGTKLVTTQVGARKGGSQLTPKAQELLRAYNELTMLITAKTDRLFHRVFGE